MSPYFGLNELDNTVGLRHQRNLKSFSRIFGRALFNLQTLMFIQTSEKLELKFSYTAQWHSLTVSNFVFHRGKIL